MTKNHDWRKTEKGAEVWWVSDETVKGFSPGFPRSKSLLSSYLSARYHAICLLSKITKTLATYLAIDAFM